LHDWLVMVAEFKQTKVLYTVLSKYEKKTFVKVINIAYFKKKNFTPLFSDFSVFLARFNLNAGKRRKN
jgi:hypothetical protein